jgi:hypothetical protein
VATETVTVPVVFDAGVVAAMAVSLETENDAAGTPLKVTDVAPEKLVPVIVTDVPPASGPNIGSICVIVGVRLSADCAVAMPLPHVVGAAQAPAANGVVTAVS